MVESTSALIMALSMLVMVSNKTRPAMIRIMEIKSMSILPISIVSKKYMRKMPVKIKDYRQGMGKK
jgi:hypothetical protein